MKQKLYVCRHCGNVIAMIRNKGVPVYCCDEKMQEFIPAESEASGEEQLPVYQQEGNIVHVTAASAEYPRSGVQDVQWICLETEQGIQYAYLNPEDYPMAKFSVCDGDTVRAVFAL